MTRYSPSILPRVTGATHQAPRQWLDKLDAEWVEMWNTHGGRHRQAEEVAVEEVRKDPAAYSFMYPTWAGPKVHQENEFDIPVTRPAGLIKVRVYTPEGTGPFPVHLNHHGGGWILGGLHSEAAWCRSVCDRIGIVIVDVDYRLAPEFVFPAAIYDSWDAIQWVIAHTEELNVDAGSISIGGLSAGGHMSAVLSHMARDAGLELKLALMIVPSTDFRWLIAAEPLRSDVAEQYPSTALYKDAPWGGLKREQWFLDYWIPSDGMIHASSGPAEPRVADRELDTSGLHNAHFETQQLEELPFHDLEHNDISNLADLAPGALLSGETNDASGDFWLDQAMMDIDMQAYNYINTPPDAAVMPQGASHPPTSTQQEMFKIACGLTGDMDPYVMQRYNFDPNNNFVFKRLTVQSMSQDIHPVQLLAYNQPESIDKSKDDADQEFLETLVSPDVGTRLISLYYQYVYPHAPVIPFTSYPEPRQSNPALLAAIYLVTLHFADFDDYLSVQIAYDLPDAERLRNFALTGVQQRLHRPDFPLLQTVILLLIAPSHKPLMPDYSTNWSLVGTMVTIAQTLGLQFDPTLWPISTGELNLRKRLSWTVGMIDVWHAASLERENQTSMPKHLVHMYKLTMILRRVLTTLYSLKAVQILARDYDATLRKVQLSMEELNQWSSLALDIETEARSEDVNLSGPMLLGGHFVKVLLFRAILRPFQTASRDANPEVMDLREAEAYRLSRAGARACVTSFLAFTADLKSGWVHGFWPFCMSAS
ncbi:hypothetical protein KCU93_g6104, partial [Aureobasidium melanogenum]